jgi:hypothetical protein
MRKFLIMLCYTTLAANGHVFSQTNPNLSNSAAFVALPFPAGPFAVGRSSYDWIDSARTETFSTGRKVKRELLVYVWYPATPQRNAETSLYIPYFARIDSVLGENEMKGQFGNAYEFIKRGRLLTQAVDNAPVAKSSNAFPVLIFSHGFGETGLTYTAMLEDLASHGYVVFAVEHPYVAYCVAFPDGRVIPFAQAKWDSAKSAPNGAVDYQLAQIPTGADDIVFTINKVVQLARKPDSAFYGCLDTLKIGAFGHSLGGMVAARACQLDSRIRAGMNQDADYQGLPFVRYPSGQSIMQPFMFMVTHHSLYVSKYVVPPTDEQLTNWKMTRVAYDSLMNRWQKNQDESLAAMRGGSYRVRFESDSFVHRSFIDTYLFNDIEDQAVAENNKQNLILAIAYTRAFFDKELNGIQNTILEETPPDSSRVFIDQFGSERR